MLLLSTIVSILSVASASNVFLGITDVNDPCTGSGGAPGVCISTSSCANDGGTSISGACPGTPNNVRCCTKTACGTDSKGNCRFVSTCASGITETGQCPGPGTFKCCMPPASGFPQPRLPTRSSGCQQISIDGAKAIINIEAFPGIVKRIDCIGDDAHCNPPANPPSDHCRGMATDMMVADGGVRTDAGEPIAEWVMRHHDELSVSYVLWGQRIWNVARDPEASWSDWRLEPDKGSVTKNHWDHVHVSYLG